MPRKTNEREAGGRPGEPDPGEQLLLEILDDEGRDRGSGARPVVSVREQEDPQFLAAVEARERDAVDLLRRGTWHGRWAELEPPRELRPRDSGGTLSGGFAELSGRWHAARPIVLHGIAAEELDHAEDDLAEAGALHGELQEARGLRRWLARRADDLEPDFTVLPPRSRAAARKDDRSRDLEKIGIESRAPSVGGGRGGRGRKVDDLWVKSAWLSTFEGDDSLRVRVAFGRERDDDASGDLLRHRLVADLATRLFPESALASANPRLVQLLERFVAAPVLLTQHIAYWNAPEGGALFHHDAFAEDEDESRPPGQLGVGYLQLTGRTAWIALSIADLALRVREFTACLDEGDLPWVRSQLFPLETSWRRALEIVEDEDALLSELARPACGALCGLVNRGPEFTAWLADAGHAAILEPGDAILLPNHGIARTAMHSVFCAGEDVAYSLSLAIRADREEPGPVATTRNEIRRSRRR